MTRKIAIASAIWGFSILASRLIGILREALIGRVLGVGREADLYFVAFTLPDYLNYLLAGGALSIVFIPIFNRHLSEGHEDAGWDSFSVIANFLLLLLGIALPALWLLVPFLAPWIAPGFQPPELSRLVTLTRIMLPAQAFHVLGGLISAALQAKDRHLLPAMAPIVYTLGVIAGGLLGGSQYGAEGFAWGVLAGSILGPFLLPLLGALGHGLRWKPLFQPRHPDLIAYLVRSAPIMVAWSIVVVDDWILRRLGSLLGAGSVAVLNYAKQLMRVPTSIFGLAAGIASFPALTRLVARGESEEASQLLQKALNGSLYLAFCAQVVLSSAGPEISRLVYGRRISAEQHEAIGMALALFCLGLWGWTAQALVARGFYALGRTWPPSLLGTLIVPAVYPVYLLLGDRWGALGLAGASALSITLYVALLLYWLGRIFRGLAWRCSMFVFRMLPGLVLGLMAGWICRHQLPIEIPAWRAAVSGTISLLAFWSAGVLMKAPEATEIPGRIIERIRRRHARQAGS